MVHVAIAGSGDMARYLSEEMTKAGHKVLILSRSHKPQFVQLDVAQIVTDYSVQSLLNALGNFEVLISTILDYTTGYIEVHQALIQACQQSPKCKRFMPSEFGPNKEEFPEQPIFYYRTREPIRAVLREQSDPEWTLISVGCMIDYIVPSRNRYLKGIGEAFPVDLSAGEILIPGTGDEAVDVTWARDGAKGLAQLINAPTWERYTDISVEQTSWNTITKIMQQRYPNLVVENIDGHRLEEVLATSQDENEKMLAEYRFCFVSGSKPCLRASSRLISRNTSRTSTFVRIQIVWPSLITIQISSYELMHQVAK